MWRQWKSFQWEERRLLHPLRAQIEWLKPNRNWNSILTVCKYCRTCRSVKYGIHIEHCARALMLQILCYRCFLRMETLRKLTEGDLPGSKFWFYIDPVGSVELEGSMENLEILEVCKRFYRIVDDFIGLQMNYFANTEFDNYVKVRF